MNYKSFKIFEIINLSVFLFFKLKYKVNKLDLNCYTIIFLIATIKSYVVLTYIKKTFELL